MIVIYVKSNGLKSVFSIIHLFPMSGLSKELNEGDSLGQTNEKLKIVSQSWRDRMRKSKNSFA